MDVGLNFYDSMHAIFDTNFSDLGTRDGSICMFIAKYEADALIGNCTNRFLSDITICSDSNQSVLSGVNCLSIKKFTFVKSREKSFVILNFLFLIYAMLPIQ